MTVPAIREARRRSRSTTPTSLPGFCKREVRECYRITVSRSSDAAGVWAIAHDKHRTTNPADVPRGAPPVWLGGSEGHGHVTIGTGSSGHWTMDLLRSGFFDRTGIALVERKWGGGDHGLKLVGWVEDYDGVPVWRDGKPVIHRMLAETDPLANALVKAGRVGVIDDGDIDHTLPTVTEVQGELL